MNKIKNLEQFHRLIKTYENITLDDIKEVENKMLNTLQGAASIMTGFGCTTSCKLCYPINTFNDTRKRCLGCVYSELTGTLCYKGLNEYTYDLIIYAADENHLLAAFKARALYMRAILENGNIKQPHHNLKHFTINKYVNPNIDNENDDGLPF